MDIDFEIVTAPLSGPEAERLMRFHAKWHGNVPSTKRSDRPIDWPILETNGTGRFCGTLLHVYNPHGGWWGEGDEKFFVDGEKSPSVFGTGSEDYFGYAWGGRELFSRPYHSQSITMNHYGHTANNRWQVVDNIPFQNSFNGYIEKYVPDDRPTYFFSTVYWYLAEGGKDIYLPTGKDDRRRDMDWSPPPPAKMQGAIEAETMKVTKRTGGDYIIQDMAFGYPEQWSEQEQLWWPNAKPGDLLELEMPVETDGLYQVALVLTKFVDYGIVRVRLNGKTVIDSIDCNDSKIHSTDPISLGIHELRKDNQNVLSFEILGVNEGSNFPDRYFVGIDYVKLEKQE